MSLTPSSIAIRTYYERRAALDAQGAVSEMSARAAFQALLESTAGAHDWTLVVEQKVETSARRIVPDGTLRDSLTLPRGYWEAKDSADDLDAEIEKKFARGYPRTNIIFEDTRRGVLIQNGQRRYEADLGNGAELAALLNLFYAYTAPNIAGFEAAKTRFRQDTPQIAKGLLTLIADAHKSNKPFQAAYASFMDLCRTSINPNISRSAVDEMLIQHLLTERLMRTVFDNHDFTQRNVIAQEVERVIGALTSRSFSREKFIGQLAYFYEAIEAAARDLTGFSEKQTFLNSVYETFFQGYAVKVADTHGIVYTPQPIVEFMCGAVEEVLQNEFGQKLGDPGVCIIDPCTGTGNFIVNLLGRIARQNPAALHDAYTSRLFANEVMLLPYYIASLNIERTFYELHGAYEAFEGLCFVDTLDLGNTSLSFLSEANAQRVQRQRDTPITVIIGNPPYNVGQIDENDNNRNRKYEAIDSRVRVSYLQDSSATLRRQLYDPYVKFFRWATDRLNGRDGIVAYISNNSFIDGKAFDGMRRHLSQDFSTLYHLDLTGNARTSSERRRQEGGNVFHDMIRVGVGITIAVRKQAQTERRVLYHRVPDYWRSEDKLNFVAAAAGTDSEAPAPLRTLAFTSVTPDARANWFTPATAAEFSGFMPIGVKASRSKQSGQAIFSKYSNGVKTNNDAYVYAFDREALIERVKAIVADYRLHLGKWMVEGKPTDVSQILVVNQRVAKWNRSAKRALARGTVIQFDETKICAALYRPFSRRYYYAERAFSEDQYQIPKFFPTAKAEKENRVICLTDVSSAKEFMTLMAAKVPDFHLVGAAAQTQCFPFYTYNTDGKRRRENITDWALAQFRAHYADPSITKWDIFYYVYGVLHQPDYRTTYADNLKRDLPRIPYLPDFTQFSQAGRRLAGLHLDYETVEPYPLEFAWTKGKPASYRVEKKMTLSRDKTAVTVNPALTLRGIPPEAFTYTLGGRSAVEWIIDQYQVKTDKSSGLVSDPNLYSDDERYIVDLLARVVRVSVETAAITGKL